MMSWLRVVVRAPNYHPHHFTHDVLVIRAIVVLIRRIRPKPQVPGSYLQHHSSTLRSILNLTSTPQISSSAQESQIDIERPPEQDREQHYGYRITQDFILAFENEIKKFIDPADFYDPTCASLTRNWLLKELRLRQLDYKCCVDPVLEPEDSADEDSEGEVEGIVDEKEDDTKTDEEGGDTTHYEDEKEDDPKTDEEGDTSHYEDEKEDDPKTDENQGGTSHYEDEKDDDTKTDKDEVDTTHYEDEKEDGAKTDEDQGDTSHYEDEKDDDTKTDEDEAIAHDHHEDTKEDDTKTNEEPSIAYEDEKEDEDEGYKSHDGEDQTGLNDTDEFEDEYEDDTEEVVVVISVCSDDPASFQARPTQTQMDMMTTLLGQPPQWWVSYRDI
ncbi:hypothetical protein EDB19DRAFT_1721920 [Suillus lakei]|nr:hypothetical protein EDB19DRAFT_1721920 [Suillus lakei]